MDLRRRRIAFVLFSVTLLMFCLPYRVETLGQPLRRAGQSHERLEFHPFYWKVWQPATLAQVDLSLFTGELIGLGLLAFLGFRPLRPEEAVPARLEPIPSFARSGD